MELLNIDFYSLVIIMFTYNFMGWFYESTLYSIVEQRRFMNRGYLLGPYCPIYGVVCISGVYFLQDIKSDIKVFIMGALIVTAIEFVTSYVLEKLFDARYWDYSEYPLNINGRVSVISSIFFGLATWFAVKILHPFLEKVVAKMPEDIRMITALSILAIFATDLILTTVSMCNLNRKCKAIYESLNDYLDGKFEAVTDKSKFLDENFVFERKEDVILGFNMVRDKIKGKEFIIKNNNLRFKENELHFFRAFPNFKSTKYNDLFVKVRSTSKLKKIKEIKEKANTKIKEKIEVIKDRV